MPPAARGYVGCLLEKTHIPLIGSIVMVLIRKDDKLILHGGIPVNYKWVGLIFVWLGSMFVGLGLWKTGSGWPLWLVLAVPFLLIGGFLLLRHQTVTTIFDLPSRRVIFTISSSVGRGWHHDDRVNSGAGNKVPPNGSSTSRRRASVIPSA
jgi:hypothetical protein